MVNSTAPTLWNWYCFVLPPHVAIRSSHVTVGAALQELMFKLNPVAPFTPLRNKHFESRHLCRPCSGKLNTLYTSFHAFFPAAGTNSYIRRKMEMRLEDSNYDPEPLPPPSPEPNFLPSPDTPSVETEKEQEVGHLIKLQKEVRKMAAESKFLAGSLNSKEGIPNWEDVEDELSLVAPNFRKVMLALGGKDVNRVSSKVGSAIAILLNSNNKFANRFQSCVSFILARTRASKQVYELLNRMGLCTSYMTMLRIMDKLNMNYDARMHDMKEEIYEKITSYDREGGVVPDNRGRKRALDFNELKDLNTYSLCMDNLNRRVIPTQTSTQRQVKELNIVTVLGFRNRAPFDLSTVSERIKPEQLTHSAFSLSKHEVEIIRRCMEDEVKRYLCLYMESFFSMKGRIKHRKHQHAEYVEKKSEIINLGAINENEGTIEGTIAILRNLKKYGIRKANGEKFPIIIYGDGLTNRNCFEARSHSAVTPVPESKFDDFEQGPGWFHAEMIQLSLDMKLFYGKGVTTGRGTLPQLRDKFLFTRVLKDTKKCFNATKRFYRFATVSYILALACKNISLNDITEDISASLTSSQLHDLFCKTSSEIVEFCWHNIARSATQKKFCYCNKTVEESDDLGLTFIGCDNLECEGASWYHEQCILQRQKEGVRVEYPTTTDESDALEDACANEEQTEGLSDAEIMQSDNSEDEGDEDNENQDEEIHYGFEEEIDPGNEEELVYKKSSKIKWYCSVKCKQVAEDRVYEYTKGLIFTGLLQGSFRQAIREGDGELIVAFAKLHLMRYTNRHHPTYRRVMTRFLAAVGGAAPLHVKHDLQFNSFLNVIGEPGHNLPVDLVNEFANKVISQFLAAGHGNLTTPTIERKTRSVGFLLEFFDMVRSELARDNHMGRTPKQTEAWKVDLSDSVKLLLGENSLFDLSATARHHPGFHDVELDEFYAHDMAKYKSVITPILKRMQNLYEVEAGGSD